MCDDANDARDSRSPTLLFDITWIFRNEADHDRQRNKSDGNPVSYLKNAAGDPVYSGPINISGLAYTGTSALTGGDFVKNRQDSTHFIHGLSIKTNTKET